ncbi:hypothetical protein LYNGBM3L_28940 [Moorena producens 3L]|uniref:Putative restriction endonuclease domain-containing protein n=1 Tax=Moorena producens 3L TaxID=489825 RepID=F4XTB3_9CYAN|nr:hypothetical protein LYNGBM3L_28940 [Moorena producens 3L]
MRKTQKKEKHLTLLPDLNFPVARIVPLIALGCHVTAGMHSPRNKNKRCLDAVAHGGNPQDRAASLPKVCPDFVIELRSKSDSLKELQAKMQEYIDNGLRLGWLIDPQNRRVEIYRSGQKTEVIDNPNELSGEAVLPGFKLKLQGIIT